MAKGVGLAIGIALGVAIGAATGNLALWIALGVVFGTVFEASNAKKAGKGEARNTAQIEEKEKHLEKLRALFRTRGELANDDVQAELGVSDASVQRYLEELQKEGFIEQLGDTGRGVRYKIKQ
jgi:predicted HTH transcriptional regulator